MKAEALRQVLLVQAIEQQDADGAVLTPAEREAATREALRETPPVRDDAPRREQENRAWRVLERRASSLYARLVERHPVVAQATALEEQVARASALVAVAGFAFGIVLSLLDSRVRIEILAFPLLGVIAWNLVVYGLLAIAALRPASARTPSRTGFATWLLWPARWAWRKAAQLVRQAALHHRPLAAALGKFADAWWPLAQPLLLRQGKRIFHLAAAFVAIGLVVGFYVRGVAFEYRAGWESTFLGPTAVREWLQVLYAPASSLTGIALPATAADVEALHWRGGAGGGAAAPWIHLMAVTAILTVVLPRLALWLVATVGLARRERTMTPPESLLAYARSVLDGSSAALPPAQVRLTPYAYAPGAAATDGVRRLLAATLGPQTQVEWRAQAAYGDEESAPASSSSLPVDVECVLFNLAATPEVENHGRVLAAIDEASARRDGRVRRVALVDESAFVARMGTDAALAGRIEERRATWREFVVRHGWGACAVDLVAVAQAPEVPEGAVEAVRNALRARGVAR